VNELRKGVRSEFPNGTIVGNLLGGHARARRDRRSRAQPFDAVAVKTADAGPEVPRLACYAHVAKFGVVATEYGLTPNHEANTDSCADGDIGEVRKVARVAPTVFGEGGAVDVGVEADRHAMTTAETPHDVDAAPPRLHGRSDVAIARRAGTEIKRTK
jgi:hypothetical protein